MEARISSARVRTTKGRIIYSLCFLYPFTTSVADRREAHGARPSSPFPIFLDQTEARRGEKKICRRPPLPTYLRVWMTSRSGSGTVDLNGIRVAGGGGGGEEGKRIKIVYIQEPIKFDGLLLYINDFALSLVLKLRLEAAWKWSFVLRVIGDILWTSCFESYGPKDTR